MKKNWIRAGSQPDGITIAIVKITEKQAIKELKYHNKNIEEAKKIKHFNCRCVTKII